MKNVKFACVKEINISEESVPKKDMRRVMAMFIGSELQSDNWGEDYLIKKLMGYFDDSYVIYRNRPIFGAQFDVCLLEPKKGIINPTISFG